MNPQDLDQESVIKSLMLNQKNDNEKKIFSQE